MVDAAGEEIGRMLYDGYGGLLANTMPMTVTDALPATPHSATGLVHLGQGRYYDPALGRPLQPNTAGGPPTLPQALNRYSATSLGQPGVGQAAQGDAFGTSYAVSFGKTLALELALAHKVGPFGKQLIQYSGRAAMAIQASASSLARSRDAIEGLGGIFERSIEDTRRLVAGGSRLSKFRFRTDIYSFRVSLDEVEDLVARLGSAEGLVQRGGWRAVTTVDSLGIRSSRVKRFSTLEFTALSLGTDVLLEFGFQFASDLGNPYLSFEQKLGRAAISGIGGGISSTAGGLVGAALGCGPAAPVCVALGGVVGGYFWEQFKPSVFQWFPGLNPTRKLAPLN